MALSALFLNKIFLAGICAWFTAQIIKFLVEAIETKRFSSKILFAPGGMPSSHTASMTAVTAMIYFFEGVSNLFVLSLAITVVIMYDSITLRKQVGIITKKINEKKKKIPLFEGHTGLQLLIGFIIGIAIAYIIKWI